MYTYFKAAEWGPRRAQLQNEWAKNCHDDAFGNFRFSHFNCYAHSPEPADMRLLED